MYCVTNDLGITAWIQLAYRVTWYKTGARTVPIHHSYIAIKQYISDDVTGCFLSIWGGGGRCRQVGEHGKESHIIATQYVILCYLSLCLNVKGHFSCKFYDNIFFKNCVFLCESPEDHTIIRIVILLMLIFNDNIYIIQIRNQAQRKQT